jgi:hypothetical protein
VPRTWARNPCPGLPMTSHGCNFFYLTPRKRELSFGGFAAEVQGKIFSRQITYSILLSVKTTPRAVLLDEVYRSAISLVAFGSPKTGLSTPVFGVKDS